MKNLRLSTKLPLLVLGGALVVGLGIGIASYFTASSQLKEAAGERLAAAARIGEENFKGYLQGIEKELKLVATSPLTIDALKEFAGTWKGWAMFGGDPQKELKAAYVEKNPNPVGSKHLLDRAETGSHYDTVHAKYHPWFRALQQDSGYYDVFLFDTEGNLVYSVFKEADYATNFAADKGGEWANTDLGNVFRAALKAGNENGKDPIAFEDFEAYGPSSGAAASFIAYPVQDADGKTLGVLAFQMPVDAINKVFAADMGIGETGEIVLIGDDMLMRTDSAHTPEVNDILTTRLDAEFLTDVFSNGKVGGIAPLYRGEPMDISAVGFNYRGAHYAVVAMESDHEALLPVAAIRDQMAIIGTVLLFIVGVVGFFASRGVTRPIGALVGEMSRLAKGDTDIGLDGARRGDEIGDMTKAVAVFRDNQIERQRLEAESADANEARREREKRIDDMITQFRADVQNGLHAVAENASKMTATAETLTHLAGGTSEQATSVAAASEEASVNVQTVAEAAQQLSASIGEISNQIDTTTSVVNTASENAVSTNEKVAALAEGANKIGAVIALIQAIAEQTNLLALNATIEAARAGDAGKGFAVVASEVKELATQTAKATEDISMQITAIQSSTGDVVSAIEEIASTMGEVNRNMSMISQVMDQQGAATADISHNVAQAAVGTQSVVENITGVTTATGETSQSANDVRVAAESVQAETGRLDATIASFLKNVTAA
ncbi:MAG: methyl-accepting chemotaxis protein [Hyphomicrobiales bacterium]|nr:MAG: methyl-accepting chemotaxis protein [Hyphomicrobiales bacterium]